MCLKFYAKKAEREAAVDFSSNFSSKSKNIRNARKPAFLLKASTYEMKKAEVKKNAHFNAENIKEKAE